ncbi:MAG: hypothetical protein KAT68_16975, partial [Bacteroidales bacterium]|nr:hypothetical protein [Bacteroidales bacterium]
TPGTAYAQQRKQKNAIKSGIQFYLLKSVNICKNYPPKSVSISKNYPPKSVIWFYSYKIYELLFICVYVSVWVFHTIKHNY